MGIAHTQPHTEEIPHQYTAYVHKILQSYRKNYKLLPVVKTYNNYIPC